MADPDQVEDFTHIKIDRDHPIVTQSWTTPYKPASKPLPPTWKNIITSTTPTPSGVKSNLSYDQDFFSNVNNQQQQRGGGGTTMLRNNLLGGPQFRPGNEGLNGTMSQKNALATTPSNKNNLNNNNIHNNNNASTFGTGRFNAFAQAARSADGGRGVFVTDENAEEVFSRANQFTAGRGNNNNNNINDRGLPSAGGMMMGGLRKLSLMNDDSDEYDDRMELNKHNIRTKNGAPPHHHHRRNLKTKEERDAMRNDLKQKREDGYNSGGDVDEGCVGALGEEDEYRADRLKFTKDALKDDGTLQSPYHLAIQHYQRRSAGLAHMENNRSAMKTPNSAAKLKKHATSNPLDYSSSSPVPNTKHNYNSSSNNGTPSPRQHGGFRPAGLRTPTFDPSANLPGPVARHQRRQHHHLLRLLHHPSDNHPHASSSNVMMMMMNSNGEYQQQQHLFPPHEIPTSSVDEARRKDRFNADTWMLGDQTVDDVMQRHFMKKP